MKPIIYLLVAAVMVSGCKKLNEDPGKHEADVYVSGTSYGDVDHGTEIAGYWKNGVLTTVNDPAHHSEANGIAIKGNDIYLVGAIYDPVQKRTVAAYWKNGAVTLLPGGNYWSSAGSISVNGSDVYVTGQYNIPDDYEAGISAYWKNGELHDLGTFYPSAIEAKGSDVYMAGSSQPRYGRRMATFWKNGIITDLAPASTDAYVSGMDIQGNDIYLAGMVKTGTQHAIATYWKNGTPVQIQPDTANSYARDIVVVNSDVYVSFTVNSSDATTTYIWKNGSITKVARDISPTGLAVTGQDVYVSGVFGNYLWPLSAYWKNGVATPLDGAFVNAEDQTKKTAVATGLVIVKH